LLGNSDQFLSLLIFSLPAQGRPDQGRPRQPQDNSQLGLNLKTYPNEQIIKESEFPSPVFPALVFLFSALVFKNVFSSVLVSYSFTFGLEVFLSKSF
jgi:hypothetical protein